MRRVKRERKVPPNRAAPAQQAPALVHSSPYTLYSALVAALLLAALGLAAYGNSFSAPFVYDGVAFIRQNESLRQLNPLKFTDGRERPVSYFTFAMNFALGGYRVWGYHAANLAIHVAACWTLFGLVRRTLRDSPRCAPRYGGPAPSTLPAVWLRELCSPSTEIALAVAALWLVHPLQTASVTYIYQRQESLAGLFYLLTLYCVLRGIQASLDSPDLQGRGETGARRGRSRAWFAAAVTFSLLGMGTKELMVTAPLMALWYDRVFWASGWRELLRRRGWVYACLGATALALVAMVLLNKAKYQSVGLLAHPVLTPLQYALSQLGVLCHYLWLCFDPHGLCLDPNWPVAGTPAAILGPALVIGFLLMLTAWFVWRRPALGFVGAWFFVILAPTSSVVPIFDLAYDHRMYLSLAAVCMAFVLGLHAVWQQLGERTHLPLFRRAWLPPVVMAAVVGVFASQTLLRNATYQSVLSIWQDTVDKAPHNPRARYSLAHELHETAAGNPEVELAALAVVNEALDMVAKPEAYLDACTLRATILERLAMTSDAAGRALAADSQLAWIAGRFDEVERCGDEARHSWDAADRMFDQAEADLRRVIQALDAQASSAGKANAVDRPLDRERALDRDRAEAWSNLGNLFARKMRADLALTCYNRALDLDPRFGSALKNRAGARLTLRQNKEAIGDLRRAIELDGFHASWYFMLALAESAEGDPAGGVRTLERAIAAGVANAETYAALGGLLVNCGRRADAEQAFRRSLALEPGNIAALMQLADLLAKAGRKREAAECYRRVLEVNPGYEPAQDLLAGLK